MGGYILAQMLEIECWKTFAGSILLQTRPSAISLESSELEYIPLVPANRGEVAQNHDAQRRSRLLFQSL